MTAVLRAHHALRAAGLTGGGHLERIPHTINEVWGFGDYIVRINPDPASRRLQDEARLLLYLPAAVRAPVPVSAGPASWGEWVVSMRLPGQNLSRTWSCLRGGERKRTVTELAHALEALHAVAAPGHVLAADPDRCPHPLPAERLLPLLADAAELPGVDPKIFGDAAERLVATAPHLDPTPTTLVHGDLHLDNVLGTPDGSITGILDFEWARPGPPDLDLDVLLHSLADPALHHTSTGAQPLTRRDFDRVMGWLREAYPALFAHRHLAERLWVYRLAYDVHDLLSQPRRAGAPLAATSQHHPYQRIVRHVQGRSDLSWFLAG